MEDLRPQTKTVSTFFELPENAILDRRRCGNTTRMTDHAINLLFHGYNVQVLDHHINQVSGERFGHSTYLLKKITDRLKLEHGLKDKEIKIQKVNSVIEIRLIF